MSDNTRRNFDRHRIARAVGLLAFFLLIASPVSAATVSYDLQFATGPAGAFAMNVVFNDDVEGKPDAIRADVTLTPGPMTGDIVALYVNLESSLVLPLPGPLSSIKDAIEGVHITSRAINTKNVQAGNIGREYSIGLAIGTTGEGKDVITATSFFFNTPGLTLQHLEAVAVRVTSIGPVFGSHDDSAKLVGNHGIYLPDDPSGVPEPGTWATVSAAVAGLAVYGRNRRRRLR